MDREVMEFDVVIVGAGPSGLAAGIRLAQLSQQQNTQSHTALNICIIDKGDQVGSHILSGAVLEPRALDELLPTWRDAPSTFIHTPVTQDEFVFLTSKKAFKLPVPPQMHNQNNYIISLGQCCRWMAEQAESLGINIFPGFAATEIIYENDCVVGVVTGDKGVDRFGKPKTQYQPGMALRAKQVIFAEGCRGSLTKQLIQRYQLNAGIDPQTYGLGLKELWEVPEDLHQLGKVVHTIGWPLDRHTYGGTFSYAFGKNLLAIGLVVGLDYKNPYLNPYEEFQRFKTHPSMYTLLQKSKRIAYGARTLIEGGIQSLPKLTFPGGVIVGDAAGFLNVAKIKGTHNAMKSGMLAAEAIYPLIQQQNASTITLPECVDYTLKVKSSWLWEDLYRVRNIRPALNFGLWPGLLYAAVDTYIFRGKAPWTLHHKKPDHLSLQTAAHVKKMIYPKHDDQVTFDLPKSLFLANVSYIENQPYHLKLASRFDVPIDVNYKKYASPETRYCPAGVYEIVFNDNHEPRLQINGGNCIHCKACDIKDPTQNITWTPSEGGSGPNYEMM